MDKGKRIGICCILAAAILVFALIYQMQESGDNSGTQTSNATNATFPAVSGQEADAVQTTEIVDQKEQPSEQTAEAEEPEYGEYSQAQMEIREMDEEVLSLIGVTKDRLSEEIRIFANAYGFAGMTETHYYGETVIDHKKNTVSAAFYFDPPESAAFKFNVIVHRKSKTFRFEPW